MKAFVVVLGLLVAVSFAQDTFFVNRTSVIVDDATTRYRDDTGVGTTVALNGHVYSMVLVSGNNLNEDYGEIGDDSTVLSVLVDVTESKKLFQFGRKSGDYYFSPRALFTDGTFLYASIFRHGGTLDLPAEFDFKQEVKGVSGALYKIDVSKNPPKVVERVVAIGPIADFSGCTVIGDDKKVVFMVKVGRETGSNKVVLKYNDEEAKTYNNYQYGSILFVSDLFSSNPTIFSNYDGTESNLMELNQMRGSMIGTGDGDLFMTSFGGNAFLRTQLMNPGSKTPVLSSTEFTVSSCLDQINLVRVNASTYVTVFTTENPIKQGSKVFCESGTKTPRLVFIKHTISGNNIKSSEPVCLNLGKALSDYPSVNLRRTLALPEAVDGKIILIAHYLCFGFDFCGTKLYTSVIQSDSYGAASVLMSVDADSLSCFTARTIDPTMDHKTKGFTAISDKQFAILETVSPNQQKWNTRSQIIDFVRCEDGIIDTDNKWCVCFEGGIRCTGRNVESSSSHGQSSSAAPSESSHKPSSSSSSNGSGSVSASSSVSGSVSGSGSDISDSNSNSKSKSSSGKSETSSLLPSKSESVVASSSSTSPSDLTDVTIALIALTALFLVTTVVFIVLFIVL